MENACLFFFFPFAADAFLCKAPRYTKKLIKARERVAWAGWLAAG